MSIAKRPSKNGRKFKWQVLIDVRDPETGKRKRRVVGTFDTKDEARMEQARALGERERGTLLDRRKTTVRDLLDDWLAVQRTEISAQTAKDYEITIRRHLKPALGGVRVQDLKTSLIQAQYARWHAAGMSARQIRGCHLRLSQALDYAVKHQLVYVNACRNATPPRIAVKKPVVWDSEEAACFLDAARNDSLSPLWHLLLAEGMRRGEALGLRWRDINWDRGTAHIVQTVAPNKSNRGEPIIQNRTKTKLSARTVRLTAETLTLLKRHRASQAERRLKAESWSDLDLIVCTRHGTPINPNNVSRSFTALLRDTGLRRIRVHDLRHTHATMLLLAGQPAKVVSERLGHASIAITLDTYSHVLPDMQDGAASAMDAIISTARARASLGSTVANPHNDDSAFSRS